MDFTRRRIMGLFSVSAAALMLENSFAKAAPAMSSSLGRDAGQLGVARNRTLFAAGTRQLADVGALDLCQALACSPNRAQLVRGLSPCVG